MTIRGILHFYYCDFYLAFLFIYFLGFPSLCFHCLSVAGRLLSIMALSLLILDALISQSGNSTTPAMSGSNACSVPSNFGFGFWYALQFFLDRQTCCVVPGKKNCYE